MKIQDALAKPTVFAIRAHAVGSDRFQHDYSDAQRQYNESKLRRVCHLFSSIFVSILQL